MANESKLTVKSDSTGDYIVVVSGNTLSEIAKYFKGKKVGNTASYSKTYLEIAKLNGISNANFISIGQKIYLQKGSGGGSSSSSSSNTNAPTVTHFGEKANDPGTLFATWTWSKHSTTEKYEIWWDYNDGNGVWFIGNKGSVTAGDAIERQSTYTPPTDAKKVRFYVKPIAKKETKNGKETAKWTADWSTVKTWTNDTPLEDPSAPSVTIEGYKLTASLTNINIIGAVGICFQVVKIDGTKQTVFKTADVSITYVGGTKENGDASFTCDVSAGADYKVRCYAYKAKKSGEWSEWSEYSSPVSAPPVASKITSVSALNDTYGEKTLGVLISWTKSNNAKSYTIQHVQKQEDFTTAPDRITSKQVQASDLGDPPSYKWENIPYDATHDATGTHYFRIRAEGEESSSDKNKWSNVYSIQLGLKPSPPTTWSSTSTVSVGEKVVLYWLHNSASDNSIETETEIQLNIAGSSDCESIKLTREPSNNIIPSYVLDTAKYPGGSKLRWLVRTKGGGTEYSEWSTERLIDIHAKPTLELTATDGSGSMVDVEDEDGNRRYQATKLPLTIALTSGNGTPTGYHLSVTSDSSYSTVNVRGDSQVINKDDLVYSKNFDISTNTAVVELNAGNINLDNNKTYTIRGKVSMTSGLTAEASIRIVVAWDDVEFVPHAAISIDPETYSANIRPYCEHSKWGLFKVEYISRTRQYIRAATPEELDFVFDGQAVPSAKTVGYEDQVYRGTLVDGTSVFYYEGESSVPIQDVTMSVYRREFDGSFTEIATGLEGDKNTTVVDPHPALDFARYRIVAVHNETGAVSYHDIANYPVGGSEVVIQWDENWNSFESTGDAGLAEPEWSGSMLKLPFNIDFSDNTNPEVEMVKYIGREHPVSYYGTQIGQKASCSVIVPRDDEETLYGLRRLSRWMGNVYFREPSGTGYWANVTVSFSQKHMDGTVPVSISITRVEGGI